MKRNNRRNQNIVGTSERPRLVIARSLKYISGQIIDDAQQKTLLGASSLSKEVQAKIKKDHTKTDVSRIVGTIIAERAKKQKIRKVVFDRNGLAYHGRVKALAEGAREGGLEF